MSADESTNPEQEEIDRHRRNAADESPEHIDRRVQSKLWLIARGLLEMAPEHSPGESTFVQTTAIGSPLKNTRAYAAAKADPPLRPIPISTLASDVKREPVGYLWPGRIPSSRVTVFMGMPDQGKSTLMSWLIATVTTGGEWPDAPGRSEPGSVIMLQSEESRSEDCAARLEDMGADTSRLRYLDAVDRLHDGRLSRFSAARDSGALEVLMDEMEDVRCVIFDPIGSFLGGCSSNSEEDIRDALEPLKQLAERRKVAMVLVAHPNKDAEKSILHRLSGSQAFGALARVIWYVSEDPNDASRRMISYVKGNPEGVNRKPLAFARAGGQIAFDPDCGDMLAKHVEYLLQRNIKVESLRGRRPGPKPTGVMAAMGLILSALAGGPMRRSRIVKKVACAEIGESTVGKALDSLVEDGQVFKYPAPAGRKGVCYRAATEVEPVRLFDSSEPGPPVSPPEPQKNAVFPP